MPQGVYSPKDVEVYVRDIRKDEDAKLSGIDGIQASKEGVVLTLPVQNTFFTEFGLEEKYRFYFRFVEGGVIFKTHYLSLIDFEVDTGNMLSDFNIKYIFKEEK